MITSEKKAISDLSDNISYDGKFTKPYNVTMDDIPINLKDLDSYTDKDILSHTSVLDYNDGHNTLNDYRDDRTQAHLLIEILRQIKENQHGSTSFIEQREMELTKTAEEILALFHKPTELEQAECQSNISYNSVANLAEFEDFNTIQSYATDDDVISQYSNFDIDDIGEETMITLDTLSASVNTDSYLQSTPIKKFGMLNTSNDRVNNDDEDIELPRTSSNYFNKLGMPELQDKSI